VVAVSSGTAALICGLAALGIGPGDEVIVPAYGFVAGVLAPLAVGAVPVVCDIDESLTLDPGDVIGKITPRTRAIMPVHVHGWAADLGAVCDIAASRGLYVVEDACQAIGGSYRGRHLGTVGDVGAFSFNQHKIVTAGEGGALLTSRTDLYERAFVSHDGSSTFSRHRFGRPDYAGLAFRLNEVSAAILNVQVGRLDDILARLRSVRDRIQAALASAADLRPVLSHDPVGACGTNLGYLFDSPEQADTFLSAVDDDEIVAFYGIGYGHSYPEWDLLHQRRGGHHPLRNPLLDSDRQQTAEGCSRSQDILRRCVIVEYPLDVDDGAVEALHARVAKAFGLFLRKDNDGGRPHS
jgi:dTDP-4-amino-4,6-dideoxygalactose transaminase